MRRSSCSFLAKTCATIRLLFLPGNLTENQTSLVLPRFYILGRASSSKLSLSIWRRKKEMTKEGLIAAKELKRLQSKPVRLDSFFRSHIFRLLKSDLVSLLAEFQRQDQVFLSMKLYDVVRKEIWYRPDMFFYRDMLMMLARNRKVDESRRVWEDLKREEVLFDQHTFGDLVRAYLDSGLPSEAMDVYDEMRRSSDPPLSLPFRVILKGLIPYPEIREKVKDDFLELFPDMIVYDAPEESFGDQDSRGESEMPILIYMFTLPLPYLGVAMSLPTGFVAGAIIFVAVLIYAMSPSGSSTAWPSPSS